MVEVRVWTERPTFFLGTGSVSKLEDRSLILKVSTVRLRRPQDKKKRLLYNSSLDIRSTRVVHSLTPGYLSRTRNFTNRRGRGPLGRV